MLTSASPCVPENPSPLMVLCDSWHSQHSSCLPAWLCRHPAPTAGSLCRQAAAVGERHQRPQARSSSRGPRRPDASWPSAGTPCADWAAWFGVQGSGSAGKISLGHPCAGARGVGVAPRAADAPGCSPGAVQASQPRQGMALPCRACPLIHHILGSVEPGTPPWTWVLRKNPEAGGGGVEGSLRVCTAAGQSIAGRRTAPRGGAPLTRRGNGAWCGGVWHGRDWGLDVGRPQGLRRCLAVARPSDRALVAWGIAGGQAACDGSMAGSTP